MCNSNDNWGLFNTPNILNNSISKEFLFVYDDSILDVYEAGSDEALFTADFTRCYVELKYVGIAAYEDTPWQLCIPDGKEYTLKLEVILPGSFRDPHPHPPIFLQNNLNEPVGT